MKPPNDGTRAARVGFKISSFSAPGPAASEYQFSLSSSVVKTSGRPPASSARDDHERMKLATASRSQFRFITTGSCHSTGCNPDSVVRVRLHDVKPKEPLPLML